jgi:hypothetical protein
LSVSQKAIAGKKSEHQLSYQEAEIEYIYKDSKNSQSGKQVKEYQTHHGRMERLLRFGHDRHLAQHQPGKSTSVSTWSCSMVSDNV